MSTIVQNYGPIYGEVVNGTVQGRPNGSIYVPMSNRISLSIPASYLHIRRTTVNGNDYFVLCTGTGSTNFNTGVWNAVAESQDLANNMRIEVSESSDFSTLKSNYGLSAGRFNGSAMYCSGRLTDPTDLIVNEQTYYIRAVLYANGIPVAVSDVLELEGYST